MNTTKKQTGAKKRDLCGDCRNVLNENAFYCPDCGKRVCGDCAKEQGGLCSRCFSPLDRLC